MAEAVANAVPTFKLVLVGDGGTGKVRTFCLSREDVANGPGMSYGLWPTCENTSVIGTTVPAT